MRETCGDEVRDESHCGSCGGETRFDPDIVGDTVGGLTLEGWNVCTLCGKAWLSKRGRPHEEWRLAKGGRSVETGTTRIRCEARDIDVAALMQRVARLPDLERALRRIAAGEDGAADIAAEVLA